ncbi:MAG: bifunctional 4-hydroxy-2-oxoglutarate aldolase/2-dehydro-3-deoxy-phosphogluconate aldolase [Acetobacteraceae bacterium]|jgi:2-dehydro-3-deoxyphosphogluconate aldolase/(4S)-4-hydroxy-2-oxoglutarate aldolase|nr:bifunctional 4-hydroxy-2-oxoglutarate aldolase/2-dehydro-3-deoxy-phosphogluconate aldolase [Acetobacteraceae bacterium]
MSHPLLPRLVEARVVPVIRTRTQEAARTAVAWLREAGFTTFEITLTVPRATELIRELAADPSLLVGAGTVRTATEAYACGEAGAKFIVCPWNEPEIVPAGRRFGALVMLGALTPDEVVEALEGFADVVKIFPASSMGGAAHIKALKSVFPDVAFCPTGGVEPGNLRAYLDAGAAFVGIGGKLADEALIAKGAKDEVMAAARAALAA